MVQNSDYSLILLYSSGSIVIFISNIQNTNMMNVTTCNAFSKATSSIRCYEVVETRFDQVTVVASFSSIADTKCTQVDGAPSSVCSGATKAGGFTV